MCLLVEERSSIEKAKEDNNWIRTALLASTIGIAAGADCELIDFLPPHLKEEINGGKKSNCCQMEMTTDNLHLIKGLFGG